MKKIFTVLIGILFLACLAPVSGTFADGPEALHHPPLQIEQPRAKSGITPFSLQIVDRNREKRFEIGRYGDLKMYSSGQTRFYVTEGGDLYQYDSTGTVETYIPSDRTVYITRATQLSSWEVSATAGQSYFQTEPGKTYIVDPYAIYKSGVTTGDGVSAFARYTFAGVSAILPDASTYSGPAYDVTVMVAITGATGYYGTYTSAAGTTIVSVWPYAGTGATTYQTYNIKPQAMQRFWTARQPATGVTVTQGGVTCYSGSSFWMLDKAGEEATFSLYDSSVSAWPRKWSLIN